MDKPKGFQLPKEGAPETLPTESRFSEFQRQFFDIQEKERVLFKQTNEKTRLEIAAVLEEIKKLATSTKKLTKELEVATFTPPVSPGEYHLTFLVKLKKRVMLFRKRVEESATWLESLNYRKGFKNYWAQAKQSGAQFLLSQDRRPATQTG